MAFDRRSAVHNSRDQYQELVVAIILQAVSDYRALVERGYIKNRTWSGRMRRDNRPLFETYRSPADVNELCAFMWHEGAEELVDLAFIQLEMDAIRRGLDAMERKRYR